MSKIKLMNAKEISKMRKACSLAAETLVMISGYIRPGVTTNELNNLVHNYTIKNKARPATLNYEGYPKSVCTSVNEVVCHGIPSNSIILKNGDIINVDITSVFPAKNGYYGDNSATFYVGDPSRKAQKIVEVSRHCLELGIRQVRPGGHLGDIGAAIQEYAESQGCSVVRDYLGHGIGRTFHMPPQVHHHGRRGTGILLKPGMVFTIEPMINLGNHKIKLLSDGWTVITHDLTLSAQFEHTVLVTLEGYEVLTKRLGILLNSEDKPWVNLG